VYADNNNGDAIGKSIEQPILPKTAGQGATIFKPLISMRLCQRPFHVQGDDGHPGWWTRKEYLEKWRAEEEERHKGSLTPKTQISKKKCTIKLCM
jgi:hypothetical protein